MRRRLITSTAIGTLITCVVAWFAQPLAVRFVPGLSSFAWALWLTAPRGSEPAGPGTARFGRSVFCDWWQIRPNRADDVGWPGPEMIERLELVDEASLDDVERAGPEKVYRRRIPDTIALPEATEGRTWARVDTGLFGWPARAFASEAWFGDEGREPMLRWNLRVGRLGDQLVLMPLRPIWSGLFVNVIFWSFVVLCALTAPRLALAWRRRRTGRCQACGPPLAVAAEGLVICSECDASVASRATAARPQDKSQIEPPTERSSGEPDEPSPRRLSTPEMRYQSAYVWLVFFSSLDIMLTWVILRRGGEEVNPLAKQIITLWGLHGAIAFKFALMLFVIIACEIIGRKKDLSGRRLSWAAVIISAFPVVYSLGLLLDHILLRPVA